MTLVFARSAMNAGHFIAHHPRRWVSEAQTPESERRYVWNISITLLEQYDMMQSSRHLQRFAWHVAYYMQWPAFIHVLDTLRAHPLMPDAVKAWQLVESMYENNPDMISNTKRPVHVAVGNLCLKAFNTREAALLKEEKKIPPAPKYITKLRQQREAARARRQTRDAKGKEADAFSSYDQPRATKMKIGPNSSMVLSMNDSESHECQRNSSSQLTSFDQPSGPSDSNAFWLTNDGLLGTASDFLDMETDLLLAQDTNLEDSTDQTISWTQWDTWLGELNLENLSTTNIL